MIYIFSEFNDSSTDRVEDWLLYLKKPYVRINKEDNVNCVLNKNKLLFIIDDRKYIIDKKDSVWLRRPGLKFLEYFIVNNSYKYNINSFISNEYRVFEEFIFYFLKNYCKKCIGNFAKNRINKIEVLELAKKCGLLVPNYFILSNSKFKDIFRFEKKVGLVTKPLSNVLIDINRFGVYKSLTKRASHIENKSFGLSFFQDEIQKEVELRVIVILDKIFCSAVFSQNNQKTKVDQRSYDNLLPNRLALFKIPLNIKNKIISLLKKLDINMASLDFIVKFNKKKLIYEYIFLELNPVGQYGYHDYECNFMVDNIIAEYL